MALLTTIELTLHVYISVREYLYEVVEVDIFADMKLSTFYFPIFINFEDIIELFFILMFPDVSVPKLTSAV